MALYSFCARSLDIIARHSARRDLESSLKQQVETLFGMCFTRFGVTSDNAADRLLNYKCAVLYTLNSTEMSANNIA